MIVMFDFVERGGGHATSGFAPDEQDWERDIWKGEIDIQMGGTITCILFHVLYMMNAGHPHRLLSFYSLRNRHQSSLVDTYEDSRISMPSR
jgi:hypothetical protein